MKTIVSTKGQIVLPAELRRRDGIESGPLAVGSVVVVGSNDGVIHVVRVSDGVELGEYRTKAPVQSSPASLASGRVVVGGDDGSVRALDLPSS